MRQRIFRVTRFMAAGSPIASEYLPADTHEAALREYARRHAAEGFDAEQESCTGTPGAANNCLVDPRYPMGDVIAFRHGWQDAPHA